MLYLRKILVGCLLSSATAIHDHGPSHRPTTTSVDVHILIMSVALWILFPIRYQVMWFVRDDKYAKHQPVLGKMALLAVVVVSAGVVHILISTRASPKFNICGGFGLPMVAWYVLQLFWIAFPLYEIERFRTWKFLNEALDVWYVFAVPFMLFAGFMGYYWNFIPSTEYITHPAHLLGFAAAIHGILFLIGWMYHFHRMQPKKEKPPAVDLELTVVVGDTSTDERLESPSPLAAPDW